MLRSWKCYCTRTKARVRTPNGRYDEYNILFDGNFTQDKPIRTNITLDGHAFKWFRPVFVEKNEDSEQEGAWFVGLGYKAKDTYLSVEKE